MKITNYLDLGTLFENKKFRCLVYDEHDNLVLAGKLGTPQVKSTLEDIASDRARKVEVCFTIYNWIEPEDKADRSI